MLSPDQVADLTRLRHDLHRRPEISGHEKQTAERILVELNKFDPDRVWRNLGGYGVAAEFTGRAPGPTVLLRCELDALPIKEISKLPYTSEIIGKGHLCGHDGHMVSILGVAALLAKQRPASGRVVLLFQPAEETGAGAKAVIRDPNWPEIRPDYAFAYHNLPGRPLGEIGLCPGSGNCASRGMQIVMEGKSSHAAAPEDGFSPAAAMAQLMIALPALSQGQISDPDFRLCTLTHANLGAPSFGISPAEGELRITLRARTNGQMQDLIDQAQALVNVHTSGLQTDILWHDVFRAVSNTPEAVEIAQKAAKTLDMPTRNMRTPMRWSEDFGRFGDEGAKAALLYVGSGETLPQLHNPDYDFPDRLFPLMTELFFQITDHLLNLEP